MHSVKEKVSNAASAAKAHVESYKANLEEKAEKATARTQEEKDIAHQRRKAKEAEAKMNMHMEKAEHAAEKLHGKHDHVLGPEHHNTLAGLYGGYPQTPVDTFRQNPTVTARQQRFEAVDPATGEVVDPACPHPHEHKHKKF
ncbi:late embryogenesis abundant protein 18-like [Bidens hawaiensis]|uniref:late embryogenesis abundant protein 18-like n=1 Tax=Bidens hawaiensis TaxID=980011 RepID=UPI00404A1598